MCMYMHIYIYTYTMIQIMILFCIHMYTRRICIYIHIYIYIYRDIDHTVDKMEISSRHEMVVKCCGSTIHRNVMEISWTCHGAIMEKS